MTRFFSGAAILALTLMVTAAIARADSCDKPWVFFDLSNTLIDTTDLSHLKYLPLAQKYLHQLKDRGYPLGLIVNVPEEWGGTKHQKIEALKAQIAKSWTDRAPFDWSLFDRILVPPTNRERKPAPFLFQKAMELASPCPAIYQGEEDREAQAAAAAGLKKFVVGRVPGAFYLPVEKIPTITASNQ